MPVNFVCHRALQAEDEFYVGMPMRVVGNSPWRHPLCYAHEPAQTKVFWINLVADILVFIVFHGPYYTSFRGCRVRKSSVV